MVTYIVANWKSNKTEAQAKAWLQQLTINISTPLSAGSSQLTNKEIIVCPPFTLLPIMKKTIQELQLQIKLGAQDISPFDEGAYTGEVNGKQIKEFADYVIIGHSERRKYFSIGKDLFEKQAAMAKQNSLKIIYCALDINDYIPGEIELLTYEPPASISPGPADTPENAEKAASFFFQKYYAKYILYGGNVTSQNVKDFTSMPHINGVLVGRASLDAQEFSKIIQNA